MFQLKTTMMGNEDMTAEPKHNAGFQPKPRRICTCNGRRAKRNTMGSRSIPAKPIFMDFGANSSAKNQ